MPLIYVGGPHELTGAHGNRTRGEMEKNDQRESKQPGKTYYTGLGELEGRVSGQLLCLMI